MEKQGTLFVISGPSGVGKGVLCDAIIRKNPNLGFSVSATTRAPRAGELDGVHYFFLSVAEFEEHLSADHFLEYTKIYGNFYGTLESPVRDRLANGQDVVLDIDTQGARRLRERFPQAVFIFILPPSMEELRARIMRRGTESPEDMEKRLMEGWEEIRNISNYDYVFVNDNLDEAVGRLEAIVLAESLRVERQRNLWWSYIKEESDV